MDVMRFTEIEHKFIVDESFDVADFGRRLDALGPTRRTSLPVRDRYFLTADGRAKRYVIRHRFDDEIHQLTIKTLSADPEVRDEITLDLGHHAGAQEAQVEAFVGRMGISWSGTIEKHLHVWYFPDCEVVHYVASSGARHVGCVEFEATIKRSVPEALAIVERYERATGFDAATRFRQSLPELLFPNALAP
jgi:hypothetical protein